MDYITTVCKGCRGAIRLPHDLTWQYTDKSGYAKYMMHSLRMGYFIVDSVCPRCEHKSRRLPKAT